jgi:kinesin family protein 4/21/27
MFTNTYAQHTMPWCLQACISVSQDTGSVRLGSWRQFTYDYAFGLEAQQQDVFAACVSPLVESFLEGYNATVLAYGPTGSGKTYTMGMGSVLHSMAEHHGVIPRVIRSVSR